ncbi:MAG TPA: hypothetical protein VFR41_13140, partial [Acidimicrobiia bacterium]|nr:hypothetical protein [Acidimicrobiia bacterium]
MKRVALAVVSAMTLFGVPGALAQSTTTTTTTPQSAAGVTLLSQSSWVALGGMFTMVLHLDDTTLANRKGAAIGVRVHGSTGTRTAFDAAMNNGDLGGIVSQPDAIPIATLPRDRRGNVTVTFGLSGSNVRPTISVRRPGVFPIEVGIVNAGSPTGTFVTWLVTVDANAAQPVAEPLRVAWLWQLVSDPATQPSGADDPAVTAELRTHGRLDRIAGLLSRASGVPISLLVGPETAESWARLARSDAHYATGYKRLRTAVRRGPNLVLPAPYVPVDATALEQAGLGDQLSKEYVRGNDTLTALFGADHVGTTRTAFLDPSDDAAVDRLRQMLFAQIVVRENALQPVNHHLSAAQPFRMVLDNGSTALAASTAPFVEQLLDGDAPAAVKAARVIAAISEVEYEAPGMARGIIVAPPTRWTPDVSTMTQILAGLRDNPLVKPVTVDDLLGTIAPERIDSGGELERHFATGTPPPTPIGSQEYAAAENELAAFRDFVGPDDRRVQAGERALLLALCTTVTRERALAELG